MGLIWQTLRMRLALARTTNDAARSLISATSDWMTLELMISDQLELNLSPIGLPPAVD